MSFNGDYVTFPSLRREYDSLHPHQFINDLSLISICKYLKSRQSRASKSLSLKTAAALQIGNSEAIIRKHYLDLKSTEEADHFWRINPAGTELPALHKREGRFVPQSVA